MKTLDDASREQMATVLAQSLGTAKAMLPKRPVKTLRETASALGQVLNVGFLAVDWM